jgi:PBP1b-binding outer membrane lipoprotein LpoB
MMAVIRDEAHFMKIFALLALLPLLLTGCYQMAGDNDFSTIPATNNPRITCEKQGSAIPGMNY